MPLKVLVVDDIAASRRAQCALVAELGHLAVGADSGTAALALLPRESPDLVMLDLLMPDMDGFEATRRMRALSVDRWLPIIVTSSLQGEDHFIHALESGADDYLARPVSAGLLDAKLRHYARVLGLQQDLATLARRQRDILDNILDPVVTLDADGRVLELNRAAAALAARDGSALALGASCDEVFGQTAAAMARAREVTLQRADGSRFRAEVAASAWGDGDRRHLTLVLRDLTERRRIERMQEEFLSTVSHELRTPLTSVLGALSLLAGGAVGALPPRAAPLVDMARRNGERLGRLVDDVLDLTKLEGDRLVLRPRLQDPWPLLQEALSANQGYAQRSGVELVLEPWAEAGPMPALALDGDRFMQVMANLLSNAIKHSPTGAAVRVTATRHGEAIRINVRDQGPGIDPAFRTRLFEKFAQADSTDSRSRGGTGLGLHITRLLVERMGGRVQADEPSGPGASLSVLLPLPAPTQGGADTRPLLLHVEADPELRARVARWLAPWARVHGLARLDPAQAPPAEAAAYIGNPQGQGEADGFCVALQRLAAGRPVLIYGDSVDDAFCAGLGLPWQSPTLGSADGLLAWVRRALGAAAPSPLRANALGGDPP